MPSSRTIPSECFLNQNLNNRHRGQSVLNLYRASFNDCMKFFFCHRLLTLRTSTSWCEARKLWCHRLLQLNWNSTNGYFYTYINHGLGPYTLDYDYMIVLNVSLESMPSLNTKCNEK
jgi:hypothetical protein